MMSETLEVDAPVVAEKPAAPADDIKENGDSDAKPKLVSSDKQLVDVKPPTPTPEPAPEENELPQPEGESPESDGKSPEKKEEIETEKEEEKKDEEKEGKEEKEPETAVEQSEVDEDTDEKPTENNKNAATEEPMEVDKEKAEKKQAETKTEGKTDDSSTPKRKRSSDEKKNEVEESESDDEKVGILEVSPVIEDGVKRARKKVERLSDVLDKNLAKQEKAKANRMPEGSGVPLGEIEYIKLMISKTKEEELKFFHALIFNRVGVHNQIKSNIRRFKGFDFASGSPEYKTKLQRLSGRKVNDLKNALRVIGLELKGTRDELAQRLLDFMLKPDESAVTAKIPGKKSKVQKKAKVASKKKASAKASKSKSKKKDEDSDDDDDDGSEDDDEPEPPKKSRSRGSKAAKPKPAPKKKTAKKRKVAEVSDLSDDDSDDRESDSDSGPASKKAKKMPTDEELKKTILGLLENVDLEKVTMKNVLHQIYEKYEGLDLTHKKEYLKSVVKDILSN